ncbi:hypothetical protein EDC31_1272 [Acidomonas methanolica]|nr:hypothetical protein EDC31_1272 [Acidomonas methanolica]
MDNIVIANADMLPDILKEAQVVVTISCMLGFLPLGGK